MDRRDVALKTGKQAERATLASESSLVHYFISSVTSTLSTLQKNTLKELIWIKIPVLEKMLDDPLYKGWGLQLLLSLFARMEPLQWQMYSL